MSYIDCITIAAQHAQDWDVPVELLPMIITSEAALLSGHEADDVVRESWD